MTATAGAADEEMSPVDYLLHRGEHNPRTRSAVLGIEYLERSPDWDRLTEVFERTSRVVVRLRQKVVVPAVPTASPRWVVDPDFDLSFHLRRMRLRSGATHREVLDYAERMIQSPLDTARALWEAVLIEDLEGGRAALLTKQSHAIADGLGGIEMAQQLYDLEPDPPGKPLPPIPAAQDVSPGELARAGAAALPIRAVAGVRSGVGGLARTLARIVRNPVGTVSGAVAFAGSAGRVLGQAGADPSPLFRGRGARSRVITLDVPLTQLREAARAGGGSLNDAYLAALTAALRLYHEKLGVPVSRLPLAVPVSLRTADHGSGGNHFAGVVLAVPVDEVDPASRIAGIRQQMLTARDEPALGILSTVAPVLSNLPDPLLDALAGSMAPPDVQASNVPSYGSETYLAGVRVERQYPIGPLPGVAMMVVLLSRAGTCYIGARFDTASITDSDLFEQCLKAGFDETLALADHHD
jgi:diacylglycerol O-acyltransferase / wax synthase